MKILVQAKNMNVTQGIQKFVTSKVSRGIKKLGRGVIGVRVYLENVVRKKNDPNGSKAKVKVEIPGEDIIVESRSHDPYQAISDALSAAERKLRKRKDKLITKRQKK